MSDITELEAEFELVKQQEAELMQKKVELDRKLREMKAAQPTQITLSYDLGKVVEVKLSKFHDGALNILRSTPGRYYDEYKQINYLPIEQSFTFAKRVAEESGVNFSFVSNAEERIYKYINTPDFKIELDKGDFLFTLHPKLGNWDFLSSLSVARKHGDHRYKVGQQEFLKVHNFIERTKELKQSLEISEEVEKLIEKLLNEKNKLRIIAAKEDSDILTELNGVALKPFQRVGVEFGVTAGSCIIGDEMGLGKTIQSLGISHIKGDKTLLIVPAGLILNWIRQIRLFLPNATTRIYEGVAPNETDYIDALTNHYDFSLISYDSFNRAVNESKVDSNDDVYPWVQLFNLCKFTRVSFDEAHYLKNNESYRFKAARKLRIPNVVCLTGTPVVNRPSELWPMLHLMNPETFNNRAGFIATYSDGGNGVRNVKQLREILADYMIRRMKKDVQKDLDPINRIDDYVEVSAKVKKVYNRALLGVYERMHSNTFEDITNILTQLLRLKQITTLGKRDRAVELAYELIDSHGENAYNKVLIFTQFKDSARAIAQELNSNYITGDISMDDRMKIANDFNTNPKTKFLVASTKAVQEGLDLTAAGSVIFVDLMWTPAAHQQAEGRAYGRLNDSHSIDSYYLLVENSIDEMIYGIIKEKLLMIEQVTDGVEHEGKGDVSVVKELIRQMKQTGMMPLR